MSQEAARRDSRRGRHSIDNDNPGMTLKHKSDEHASKEQDQLPIRKTHRRSARNGRFMLGYWVWEWLACLSSLCCMAAIIAILGARSGRRRSAWSDPYGISPNTAIAILATLAKTSALFAIAQGVSHLKWIYFEQRDHKVSELQVFDDASRGPLGALILVGQMR